MALGGGAIGVDRRPGRPGKVWDYLRQSAGNGELWAMTRVTLTETLVGLALGVAVGILLALMIALLPWLAGAVLEPFVTAIYAMPKFVLAPILFLWFGTGFVPRLTMITATIFPVVAIYLLSGIRTVDPDRVEMMRLTGARPHQVATKLLLPHAVRYLITAVVYVAPHALAVAIAAELLFGTTEGIGGALSQNAQYFNAAGVLGALAVGTVISVLLMALTGASAVTWSPTRGPADSGRPDMLNQEPPPEAASRDKPRRNASIEFWAEFRPEVARLHQARTSLYYLGERSAVPALACLHQYAIKGFADGVRYETRLAWSRGAQRSDILDVLSIAFLHGGHVGMYPATTVAPLLRKYAAASGGHAVPPELGVRARGLQLGHGLQRARGFCGRP